MGSPPPFVDDHCQCCRIQWLAFPSFIFSTPRLGRNKGNSPHSDLIFHSRLRFVMHPSNLTCMLDFDVCNQARLERDPAYDGIFFTGVRTTGIYCRPVCPVKKPLTKNVEFFPTAAAAEVAGFRPCLRCRPETAPFCSAWIGTKTTVNRALALIDNGALDESSVEKLSERLGVGGRHLTRLFRKHLGATPSQIAQTTRIQRAKRLIDQTDESMVSVAALSGFSSLRRFNAVFLEVYGRSPSSLRRQKISLTTEPTSSMSGC